MNQQYYLAVEGDGDEEWIRPWSVGGVDVEGSIVVSAFDDQGNLLWWHENTRATGARMGDIYTDDQSHVYITGKSFNYNEEEATGHDSFAGYEFIDGPDDTGANSPF